GRKRVFLYGTAAVVLTSILAAMASNDSMMLTARFLQGAASATLAATQVALVSSVFAPKQRGQMIGLLVASVYVGLAAGPLIGGFVIDTLGWRYVFLLQIPLALVVLALGKWRVPGEWTAESEGQTKSMPQEQSSNQSSSPAPKKVRARYDVLGSVGYSVA